MKKFLASAALMLCASFTAAAVDYTPRLGGVLRTRWELKTESGDQRFQVRNARVTLTGNLAPSISYFFQTDFCNSGKFIFLDAYGRIDVLKGLYVQAGQFRMPFGIETFRAPINYYFSNRSFMAKQVMNYRAVGAKAAYKIPDTPLKVEFGVFNPTTISDHTKWNRTVTYAGSATLTLPNDLSLTAGYASIKPASVRANLVDACLEWHGGPWLLCAEYMYKHYCHRAAADVHTYVAFADWHRPVRLGAFNRWSVQARYDGMTDHANMTTLAIEDARRRLTIGSTLTYTYKALHADVRLNYEKYFRFRGSDLFVAELVIRL